MKLVGICWLMNHAMCYLNCSPVSAINKILITFFFFFHFHILFRIHKQMCHEPTLTNQFIIVQRIKQCGAMLQRSIQSGRAPNYWKYQKFWELIKQQSPANFYLLCSCRHQLMPSKSPMEWVNLCHILENKSTKLNSINWNITI